MIAWIVGRVFAEPRLVHEWRPPHADFLAEIRAILWQQSRAIGTADAANLKKKVPSIRERIS
jgi:hypothetical protein